MNNPIKKEITLSQLYSWLEKNHSELYYFINDGSNKNISEQLNINWDICLGNYFRYKIYIEENIDQITFECLL